MSSLGIVSAIRVSKSNGGLSIAIFAYSILEIIFFLLLRNLVFKNHQSLAAVGDLLTKG